ncbi:hypothetical protein BMR02_08750 [Methylococcaceae bacterium HT1]|nr:hypothetical protein BMR02_08750 [Methylococcaceae bacterium HT1]TXL23710.1 hypothetical protein BMR03_00820 [Methylococcaceae bacterium HT2]
MFVTTKSGRKIKLPNDTEDAEITRQALADGTYLSDEELAQLKPVTEFSELESAVKASVGRPMSNNPKKSINIRLSPEVLEYFRATGKGWQTRMDSVLREYVESHHR